LKKLFSLPIHIIAYRYLYFLIFKKKSRIITVQVDSKYGIVSTPNQVNWRSENIIYVKVKIRNEVFYTTKAYFNFINSVDTNQIKISLYGIGRKYLYGLEINTNKIKKIENTPEIIYRNNFESKKMIISDSQPKLLSHSFINNYNIIYDSLLPKLQENTIQLSNTPDKILLDNLNNVNNEKSLKYINNQLKKYGEFLQKPQTKQYNEITMERSRL